MRAFGPAIRTALGGGNPRRGVIAALWPVGLDRRWARGMLWEGTGGGPSVRPINPACLGGISIPDVPFVEGDAMVSEETAELVLKRFGAVVFLLIENVVPDPLGFVRTDTEKAVPGLPMKQPELRIEGLYEFRGVFLEDLQNLRGGQFSGDLAEHVDVIGDAANDDVVAFEVLKNARLIGMHAWANGIGEVRSAVFRGKHDVHGESMKGLRHTHPENGRGRENLSGNCREFWWGVFKSQGGANRRPTVRRETVT